MLHPRLSCLSQAAGICDYVLRMARGWESKSIESQQQAADDRTASRPPVTDLEQQMHALELSRTRIHAEIAASSNPRFRALKQRALDHLDTQVAALQAGILKH